jgi:hypothetical protein
MKKSPKNSGVVSTAYDFSNGVRGKYAKSYAKGSNVVILDPDVAKVFGNREAVNRSLRKLAKTMER